MIRPRLLNSFELRVVVTVAAFILYLLFSEHAAAHSLWKPGSITPARTADLFSFQKTPPCGGLPRGNNPVSFQAGSTITVEWLETIQHRGFFQIYFSPANDANFVQLMAIPKKPKEETDPVLNIPDTQDGMLGPGEVHEYSATITLPNTPCTDCTLRLMQVMLNNNNEESYYYSCSDIQLLANNPNDVTPPNDVANVAVAPGDTQASLSWTNPANDFYQVLVLQNTASIGDAPIAGTGYQVGDPIGASTVAYAGNGQASTVSNLGNGNSYYFKAFAYDLNTNYAAGVEVNTTLPDPPVNVAPQLDLIVQQGGNDTLTLDKAGGQAVVQAVVTDGNPNDQHSYDWSASDPRLMDSDGDAATLTLDPGALAGDQYAVNVTVMDNGVPAQSITESIVLNIAEPAAPASSPTSPLSSASGGGCTVSPNGRPDPLFPLLLFLASAYLFFRHDPYKEKTTLLRAGLNTYPQIS